MVILLNNQGILPVSPTPSLGRRLFSIFLSPAGLFALAALDATVFFALPFGIDAGVIILSVRRPDSIWQFPIIATAGSLVGTMITFWMGRKLGEAGLEKRIPKRRLESTKAAVRKKGTAAIALLSLIPPPFPFTAFVLASGALGADAAKFFSVLGMARLARFGTEAFIAAHYGASVFHWIFRR